MKNNKIWAYTTSHKAAIAAYLIATILYSIYQFYPPLNQFVSFGLMMILHTPMLTFAVAPWIVAGMLCTAIAIIFWLASIRNNIIAALLGFSINYFVISLLTTVLEENIFIEVAMSIVISYAVFAGVSWLISKVKVSRTPSIVIGALCLGLALYFTPTVTHPINARRAITKADAIFKNAVGNLSFTPYYPTYSSSILPASPAKLNGYASTYSNETVTFMLGNARVKQGGYLKGQDGVMNFIDNCTIYRIWFSLEDAGAKIKQDDIDHSIAHPQKCNLIQTTPTGKKVYFNNDAQSARFYVKLNQTNFIIEFDSRKYKPSQLDEILKIIDSLRPFDKSKLEDGNSYGHGFSS